MHSLAICGDDVARQNPQNPTLATLDLDGVSVTTGIMVGPAPVFDPVAPATRHSVLVEVDAFSCNYRDRALVLRAARDLPADRWYPIGSEFVARVAAVGADVTSLAPGTRVIPDGAWPGGKDRRGGLPTNHGSRGVQVLPDHALVAVPEAMPDEVAAGFTIGAQTSYSMLRVLDLAPDSRLLVTAAGSNTSLFALQAARNAGHHVTAMTSTDRFVDRLADLGADDVLVVDRGVRELREHPDVAAHVARHGRFHAVVDPFFDVHLAGVLPLLTYGGRYVTCGFAEQSSALTGRAVANLAHASLTDVMTAAMVGGHHLIGNCLGTTDDLRRALRDHASGRLDPVVDTVHTDGDAAGFLERTFTAPGRFGKVVYRHDPGAGLTAADPASEVTSVGS